MIDEKKKEEAAQAICFDDKMSYDSYCKIEGFRKGAKWAINEFLKDLWHQTDEEPERMKEILLWFLWHNHSKMVSKRLYNLERLL